MGDIVQKAAQAPSGAKSAGTRGKARNASLKERIVVQSLQYPAFDEHKEQAQPQQENIKLMMDVPLHVSVVLGRSNKSIKEVVDLKMGSVIVLDRLAGEMLDVMINGKLFARGEVVVIDDNYGVRIAEIARTKPDVQ